jgi:hypothetical protein
MGILDNLFGNATDVDVNKLKEEFSQILVDGENIECAYQIFRDKWVFTDKRLIMLNVQGVTGSKREYHSLFYKSITHFSIETGGTFDGDSEMKIWLSGSTAPFVKEFSKGVDIRSIQKMLAKHIMALH